MSVSSRAYAHPSTDREEHAPFHSLLTFPLLRVFIVVILEADKEDMPFPRLPTWHGWLSHLLLLFDGPHTLISVFYVLNGTIQSAPPPLDVSLLCLGVEPEREEIRSLALNHVATVDNCCIYYFLFLSLPKAPAPASSPRQSTLNKIPSSNAHYCRRSLRQRMLYACVCVCAPVKERGELPGGP